MEIICCRSTDKIATKAFQLHYQICGAEIGVNDDAIDHQSTLYIHFFDDAARVYVAIRGGNAIATCRSLYDCDFDFPTNLSQTISSALEIPHFLTRSIYQSPIHL